MNEIINSILEAENKAENILSKASEKAKSCYKKNVDESEKIKEDAIDSFKLTKKDTLLNANLLAEKKYDKKMKEGELEAESLISSVRPKIDKIVFETLNDILGK